MSSPFAICAVFLATSGRGRIKLLLLVAVVIAAGALYWQFGDALSLNNLADREAQLRQFQQEHPVLVYCVAFVVYVAVTGLSLPGAAGLSLLYGWFFGFWRGVVLLSFASTTGATIAFLLSRFFLRDAVEAKYGDRLSNIREALASEGPFYLFSLRLIPLVPFFVINLVMGLTPIRTVTFWWVSQLGMFPGTCAYVYAGASVPELRSLADQGIAAVFSGGQLFQLFVAFGLLAALPFLLRYVLVIVKRLLGRKQPTME
jgi:uncharacterized membrane protein YdjX (TVP38/TMEM64 family)